MKIEEIDKWLDNEYGVSYTRLEELHDFVVEQDLKHREEKDIEIERLSNIINELIEDIPCLLEIINRNEKDIKVYQDEWIAIKSLENKLQELKGDSSNE